MVKFGILNMLPGHLVVALQLRPMAAKFICREESMAVHLTDLSLYIAMMFGHLKKEPTTANSRLAKAGADKQRLNFISLLSFGISVCRRNSNSLPSPAN